MAQAIAAMWLLATLTHVPDAQAPVLEPMLVIEAKIYGSEGQQTASATKDDAGLESYVWTSADFCRLGTSATLDKIDRKSAPIAWRVSGRMLPPSGDKFFAEVEWQRVTDAGPPSTKRSMRIAAAGGEHVLLEKLVSPTPSVCGLELLLQASIVMRSPARVASGGGRSGTSPLGSSTGPSLLAAELWLVHTRPDGTEEGRTVSIRPGIAGAGYAFPFFTIRTGRGNTKVEVSGFIRPIIHSSNVTGVTVMVDRHLTSDGTPPVNTRGNSSKQIMLPSPKDVVAFELPPLQSPEGELLRGHQFSLRMRITPIK